MNPIDCTRCGKPHERCNGHNKAGQPCMRYPRTGATVCPRHGGGAPQVKAAAEKRRIEQAAVAAVATYGLSREIAPDVALLEEVHRTAGHVAWLGEVIAMMQQDNLTQWSEAGRAPSVWLRIYQDERAHLVRVAKSALDAGIAERQVKLAEQQGALLAGAVNRILDALDLSPQQRARVPEVVPSVLRALEGGAA